MSFFAKKLLPFRLKLLLTILAAAAAGSWLTYAGFSAALEPFYGRSAAELLLSRLQLRATALDCELKSSLESARLAASQPGLSELLNQPQTARAELQQRLAAAAALLPGAAAMDLVRRDGTIAASLESTRIGADLSSRAEFKAWLKGRYIGAPRAENGGVTYQVSVPVPPVNAGQPGPSGFLLCRFRLTQTPSILPNLPEEPGPDLLLAKKGAQSLLFYGPSGARQINIRSAEGTPFLTAMAGKPGHRLQERGGDSSEVYAWAPLRSTDWVIAAKMRLDPLEAGWEKLLQDARLGALLALAVLAAAAFLASRGLSAGLAEAGQQASELMERCGKPVPTRNLAEPDELAEALSEVSELLKAQAAKDLQLEAEAEKLREEESDLKSQNDELEKLNNYLMEREIKISELKQEITDLREKVGDGSRE
ncbi:MAG: hypothetical protein NDI60_10050 [Elusimicrobiales bacterium]|nr:hypothetical protein [Elusimicrobiales bacterium]